MAGCDNVHREKSKYTGIFNGFATITRKGKRTRMIKLCTIRELGGCNVGSEWLFNYSSRFKKAGPFNKGDIVYFEHRFLFDADCFSSAFIGSPSRIRKIEAPEDIAAARPQQYKNDYDWPGFFKYLKEKHNGDGSTMTKEEAEMFKTAGEPVDERWPCGGQITHYIEK